jgi:4-hydroxybutyrate CoA-transferase
VPTLPLPRALGLIPDGARVIASPGCGGPTTLLRGLGTLGGPGWVSLYSGLQLDGYPFLPALTAGALSYTTWHVMSEVRDLVASGSVGYVPVRASEVPALLELWDIDVALIRVGPPAADGSFSLGPSVSYPLPAALRARVVLAELDESLPRTCGRSTVPAGAITALVTAESPTPSYQPSPPTPESAAIAAHVIRLLPIDPVIQVGIGGVSEALVPILADAGLGSLRFVGMGSDPMVELIENGTCTTSPAITAVELMGSVKLMAFSNQNRAVEVHPSTTGHSPSVLGAIDRLVSVNAAIEVDLTGQVNSEVAGGRQLSGVGGSVDFVESAYRSEGGLRVTVVPSATSSGRSRIVLRLGSDGTVTTPRCMTDIVVTEHGVARLRGRTLAERAEALIAIAHPDHRDTLADGVGGLLAPLRWATARPPRPTTVEPQ